MKAKSYSDKSYVTLEQRQCVVCGTTYDTGSLLLDKRLRDCFDHYTVTGTGLCPEHDKLFKDGYLALVGCDEKKTKVAGGKVMKPEDAYRTGTIVHIRKTVAREIFNIEIPDKLPMMFCDEEVVAKLQAMMPKDETTKGEGDNGKDN